LFVGEYIAPDEKNFPTRCRSNPLVSMVKEKSNSVIGIWFFQICLHLENIAPYMTAT